jgi:hypothetical protein
LALLDSHYDPFLALLFGSSVDIQGGTEWITLAGNEITETRGGAARSAIRMGPDTKHITLRDNRIKGFAKGSDGSNQ